MEKDNLLKRLESLGFTLFAKEEAYSANETLADVVKSHDLRLWEGFPVVLANSAERGLFDFVKVNSFLKQSSDKVYFVSLVALSLALYEFFDLKFNWAVGLYKMFSEDKKKASNTFFRKLKENNEFEFSGHKMSAMRLKSTFSVYFQQKQASFKELLVGKEEFGLEYALSQVFSPKQKELFLKKLKGEKLTKTEKEYFSRTVKKKVQALANTDLHQLCNKLLDQL